MDNLESINIIVTYFEIFKAIDAGIYHNKNK